MAASATALPATSTEEELADVPRLSASNGRRVAGLPHARVASLGVQFTCRARSSQTSDVVDHALQAIEVADDEGATLTLHDTLALEARELAADLLA